MNKHSREFSRSGLSFSDRVGKPTEADAALGRVALGFSLLEDTVRGMIQVLMAGDDRIARIVTVELSFRQAVDVLGAVASERINALVSEDERQAARPLLDELLFQCRQSEQLRNTYLHSSYHGDQRVKASAKGKTGLRVVAETTDSALLLDVADFISETAWICLDLPLDIRFADDFLSNGGTTKYFRQTEPIGSFTLPAADHQRGAETDLSRGNS